MQRPRVSQLCYRTSALFSYRNVTAVIIWHLYKCIKKNKQKKKTRCYRHNVQSYAGMNGCMSSLHINNVLSAKMGLDLQRKATSAMRTLFTQFVPHTYSLQKERWLHYMYRVTQKGDSMYSIYIFPFKIIQLTCLFSFFLTTSHKALAFTLQAS